MFSDVLAWRPEYRELVVIPLVATACYVVYHYFCNAEILRLVLSGADEDTQQVRSKLLQRLMGALVLGALPAIIAATQLGWGPAALGLRLGEEAGLTLAWIGGSLVVLVPLVAAGARRPRHHMLYPEVRAPVWTRRLVVSNLATWVVYLIGYELLFRGFLLVPLADRLGSWPALALMTGLYTLAHLNKQAGEALGSLLMGFVFGAAALTTGSLVAPIVIHIGIATTSELVALRTHPDLRYVGTDSKDV